MYHNNKGAAVVTKEALIAIVGPTAVGKTDLSIKLAQQLNGEIISGDSMQVYKTMDIGTAKATEEEQAAIPHHLIDILDPEEPWTVAAFQERALAAIQDIRARGKLPIVVGGTGLYIQSITHELSFADAKSDPAYREQLEAFLEAHGIRALHQQLEEQDPKAAETIHPNNSRRVIRALEVIHTTGVRFSEQENQLGAARFNTALIGLTMDRQKLYERINVRVDLMMKQGLLEEVKRLYDAGVHSQAIQAIGYKELYAYFNGDVALAEAVDLLKKNSRHYAKRQLTWFRNRSAAEWFNVGAETPSEIFTKIVDYSCRKIEK
ncbi:tRNA (adenosine(37)-N6)-dimethylallyltransferase MiaA [Shouchella xiaoxiensis]|uniref:tRNA (adenosine(37)-N6)-dimethylallyltransferase MiaA n=1 Tax=Shouchella xiaoxiensis TaxID=766895 RepID=UPI00195648A8|nr:tRNA (adenosine(37)-N6)-dimethylallyltransferase MiaA [Shouchella xiaoxiensis]